LSSNTNIGNTPVNQGYVQLIHTGETGGIDGTLRTLYDGDGTASDLQIASNAVKISTQLYIGSKTITEYVQDVVGDMFTTGSYTNITTTYDDTNGNIDLSASGEVTLTGTQTLTNKTLASPTFTGTANGANLTLTGDLTVSGDTIFTNSNTVLIGDAILTLNADETGSPTQNAGFEVERGTSANKTFIWNETDDKWTIGSETFVASTVEANLTGNVTGNVTGSASLNLLISNNLSDLASASTARSNLGVAIGSDVQAYNSTLASVADGTYTGDDSITTLGTIGTGVWQGTAIASAYLDADTAHLSGTQTFSGAKTFSSTITGNLSGNVTGDVTGNADTSTKIASITNSNIVQLTDTQTLTNKTLASPAFTGDINFTDASTPVFNVTDTTNTVTTKIQSADSAGLVGTSTDHNFNVIRNNVSYILLQSGIIMINNPGNDVDFNIKDSSANSLFRTDAANSRVGILDASPSYTLDVNGIGRFTGGIIGDVTGNADTATKWANPREISLTGDITGVTGASGLDGSADVSIATTIANNSVALGTQTTGNYMENVSAGTGISVSHTPSEGSTATISTNDSAIVHDNLSGFVANEHIDWTIDQGATNIHAGNYTDTNQLTTFVIQDGDTTNVTIDQGKYVKFQALTNGGLDIDWASSLGAGSSGDPYDLQFKIDLSNMSSLVDTLESGDNLLVYNADEGTALAPVSEIQSALNIPSASGTTDGVVTLNANGTLTGESGLTYDTSTLALTGDFNVGSGDFFVDDSAGQVGIGTSSPASKLHIDDATNYNMEIRRTLNNGIKLEAGSGSPLTSKIKVAYNDFSYIDAITIVNQTAGAYTQGNVGIGTQSPAYTLDVEGDINLSGNLRKGGLAMMSIDSSYTTILKPSGAVGIYLGQSDAANYYDNTRHRFRPSGGGSTYYMTISTGGLGISRGTDDAEAKLHIGDADNSNNALASNVLGTTSGDSIDYIKLECDSTNANQLIFSSERVADGSTWTTTRERIYRRVDASNMGYIEFGSSFSAASDMISFGEVGVAKYMGIGGDGRVTIGNNQDDVFGVLTIAKDANEEHLTLKTNYADTNTPRGAIKWRDGSNVTGAIHTEFDGTDVSMRFGSLYNSGYNTTTRMTLTGQGQLGIGTSTPSEKLDIRDGELVFTHSSLNQASSGTIRFNEYNGDNVAGSYMRYNGSSNSFHMYLNNESTDYEFLRATRNSHLVLQSGGNNVGIGVASPADKLHVDGSIRINDSSSGGLKVGTSQDLQIYHNGTNSFGADNYTGILLYQQRTQDSHIQFRLNEGGTIAEKFRMEADGDFHAHQDVIAYSTTPSDKKLKTNIKDIEYGLDTIMKLNPKEYDWKKDNRHDIGFIAQEVEEVIPEIVKDKKHFDKEIKTLDYEKLTAVLIKAVQEQQEQINELKEKLNG
jgi:hypothetical protein